MREENQNKKLLIVGKAGEVEKEKGQSLHTLSPMSYTTDFHGVSPQPLSIKPMVPNLSLLSQVNDIY